MVTVFKMPEFTVTLNLRKPVPVVYRYPTLVVDHRSSSLGLNGHHEIWDKIGYLGYPILMSTPIFMINPIFIYIIYIYIY